MKVTDSTVVNEHAWATFRRTAEVRVRARHHGSLLVMDGRSAPQVARWLYRDVELFWLLAEWR